MLTAPLYYFVFYCIYFDFMVLLYQILTGGSFYGLAQKKRQGHLAFLQELFKLADF